mgnify:CR=1 FL=1|jgi:hypothetical protein|tara:strand:+ start:181 stop:429 length:249 start_codon:yes stop_codon:yes gene_type:complete
MTHKERLFKALKSECEAEINEALLTMDMCFTKATAIGEHTAGHFLQEAMKALEKLTDGRDKLDTLEQYYAASSIFNKKQILG